MTTIQEGDEVTILEGSLSIYQVEDIHRNLVQKLEAGGDVVLDLGPVDECDSAGVQLLVATRLTAARRGLAFRVREVSQAVIEAFVQLGLDPADALNLETES